MQARVKNDEVRDESRWGFLFVLLIFLITACFQLYCFSFSLSALISATGALLLCQSRLSLPSLLTHLILLYGLMVCVLLISRKGTESLQFLLATLYYLAFAAWLILSFFAFKRLLPYFQHSRKLLLLIWCTGVGLVSGVMVWQSWCVSALLSEKHRILGERSGRIPDNQALSDVFPSRAGHFYHAAGGIVRLDSEGGHTVLVFQGIPQGKACWSLAAINHIPGIGVQIDSKTLHGPGEPRTVQEQEAFRSEACGSFWNVWGTVIVKFIFT